jgi:hypothetical protein
MKIPKKLLSSAAKMFKSGGSAWSKKKRGISFAKLEGLRRSESNLGRGGKMKSDIYGNKRTLEVNNELGRMNQWRMGEKYAPSERSKFDPYK